MFEIRQRISDSEVCCWLAHSYAGISRIRF